uniref:Uncharacterized protein n=1 Tax=mine drainage metagenome TaxID=410659 RepID=E6QL02_9ZZZZ
MGWYRFRMNGGWRDIESYFRWKKEKRTSGEDWRLTKQFRTLSNPLAIEAERFPAPSKSVYLGLNIV